MNVLHLFGNQLFTRSLRDVVSGLGYEICIAACWEGLWPLLAKGPHDLAIIWLEQPGSCDEQCLLQLARDARGAAMIWIVTDDQEFVIGLQAQQTGVFMRLSLDSDPLVLRDALMLMATSRAPGAGTVGWREVAPGVCVQQRGLRWTLQHDEIEYLLSVQETVVLQALLAIPGQPVTATDIEQYIGAAFTHARMRVVVKQLREKLEDEPAHPRHLLTAREGGYCWQR